MTALGLDLETHIGNSELNYFLELNRLWISVLDGNYINV